jgi:hypothetical protein
MAMARAPLWSAAASSRMEYSMASQRSPAISDATQIQDHIARDPVSHVWTSRIEIVIVSAGTKHPHIAGLADLHLGGDAVGTLHKILNSAWLNPGAGATIDLAPNGRVLADGVSNVRGVLDAGPRHTARPSSVRLQSPAYSATS